MKICRGKYGPHEYDDKFVQCPKCRKAYKQTPECKAKDKAYKQTPKYKAKAKEYKRRPEVKEKNRVYSQKPTAKAKRKVWLEIPENKERTRLHKRNWEQSAKGKAKKKAYRARPEVKEKRREEGRRYRKSEKGKARQKRYYNTPEGNAKVKRNNKKWKSSPAGRASAIAYNAKRSALAAQGDLVKDEVLARIEEFNQCCAYCSVHLLTKDDGVPTTHPQYLNIDHIVSVFDEDGNPQGQHTKANIIPACYQCNDTKGRKPVFQWMANKNITPSPQLLPILLVALDLHKLPNSRKD